MKEYWILLLLLLTASASIDSLPRKIKEASNRDPSLPQVAYKLKINSTVRSNDPSKYLTRHIIRDHVPSKVFVSFVAHSYRVQDPLHHVSVLPPPLGCSEYSTPGETAEYFGGCDVATNGGFFIPKGRNTPLGCVGPVISNGHVVQLASRQNVFLGIEKIPGGRFQYAVGYAPSEEINQRDWLQLLSGVVWLVKDGASFVKESLSLDDFSAETSGDGETFASLVAPRLAAGFDKSGAFVVVAIDGSEPDWQGLSLYDFATVLVAMGVQNAINLDGGGSVSVFEDDNVVNVPSDLCPNVTFPRYRCPRTVGSILCVHSYESLLTTTKSIKTLHRTCSPSVTETEESAIENHVHRPFIFSVTGLLGMCAVVIVAIVAVSLLLKLVVSRRRYPLENVHYDAVDCDTVVEVDDDAVVS
jgi:hypothetical protein